MKSRLPRSVYNWLSIAGATLASITFFMIVFLFSISFFLDRGGTYLGLVIYIILPAFLILGLVLIPIGMWREHIKTKKGIDENKRLPYIDLNDVRHRNAFFIFIAGTSVFLLASAIGSYEAFEYTESNEFCGQVCHTVMNPEFVAYQNSAHAKVRCVDCHVGSGADWFVRSKLSGLYQVYAVAVNNYPRPIPTPIANLRPAQETCEQCHWPEKFYQRKLEVQNHYLADEENTHWQIHMKMKVASESSAKGLSEGIHWHINPEVRIEYVSTDSTNQEIPWVKYTNERTKIAVTYNDEDNPIDEEFLSTATIHTMDCIDCHNRPSHIYQPPAFFLDEAIASGRIPKELPEIKYVSIGLCEEEFNTMEEALQAIDSTITEFYNDNYPEIIESNSELVQQAISGFQNEYSKNIFPEMKVRWSAYPNNIGHVEFNGCFRCHTDTHISETERVISKDCNLCHYISAQGTPPNLQTAAFGEKLEFKHPEDIDEAWKDGICIDCHTGLAP
jgi:hypothetical protein